jgi:hypothetical protein
MSQMMQRLQDDNRIVDRPQGILRAVFGTQITPSIRWSDFLCQLFVADGFIAFVAVIVITGLKHIDTNHVA